jgi:hypothetical protein
MCAFCFNDEILIDFVEVFFKNLAITIFSVFKDGCFSSTISIEEVLTIMR